VPEALNRLVNGILDEIRPLASDSASFAIRVLAAAAIVVAAMFVVRHARRRIRAVFERRRVKNNLPELLATAAQVGAYIVIGALALGVLGVDPGALVTAVGLATAALSLALQDVLKSLVAGLYLLAEQPFRVGDRIRVSGEEGSVERVEIRTTVLRNDRSELVLVPNIKVFTEIIQNRSTYGLRQLRIVLQGLDLSPDDVESAVLTALAELPGVGGPRPRVEIESAGPSGLNVSVTLWHAFEAPTRAAAVARLRACFPSATVSVAPG
jgi:small-conductance mechanosensitive channel